MRDRLPRYKNHRIKNYDYGSDGYYHIEINTKFRKNYFGTIGEDDYQIILSEAGKIVEEEWFKTAEIRKEVTLDEFKIMPDHFHGIIKIGNPVLPRYIPAEHQFMYVPYTPGYSNKFGPQKKKLGNIVNAFKGACTRKIHLTDEDFDWQVSYHDEVIRDLNQLKNCQNYVNNNVKDYKKKNLNG